MTSFQNLPPAGEYNSDLVCIPSPHGFSVRTSDGWKVCDISRASDIATANDIAQAITRARDAGFEHGRRHIRTALGL